MINRFIILLLLLVNVNALAGPQSTVVTSIRPLGLIAQELLTGIDAANVVILLPETASPHGFSLQPSDMQELLTAPIVVWLGAEFEPYLAKAIQRVNAQHTQIVTVTALKGIRLLPGRDIDENTMGEEHALGSHHDHHGHDMLTDDPHLWWSAHNGMLIAEQLAQQLIAEKPQFESQVQKNLTAMQSRLQQAQREMVAQAKSLTGNFLIYHDSLRYLEQEVQLGSQRRVAVSQETKPSVKDMLSLLRWLQNNKVNCLILEPGASQQLVRRINPKGIIAEVTIDPLGWDSASYTAMWLGGAQTLLDCASGKVPVTRK